MTDYEQKKREALVELANAWVAHQIAKRAEDEAQGRLYKAKNASSQALSLSKGQSATVKSEDGTLVTITFQGHGRSADNYEFVATEGVIE